MTPPVAHVRTPRRRQAFTLLEVIIALGIGLILLAGIYSAIEVYMRITITGQDQVAQAQIIRAIFNRMSNDAASVVFAVPEEETEDEESLEDPATGDLPEEDAAEEEIVIDVGDSVSAMQQTSLGIVGDSTTIMLHISRPARGLSYAEAINAGSIVTRTSDLMSVSYFLAAEGGSSLGAAVASLATSGGATAPGGFAASDSDGIVGLARLEGDRMALDYADAQADIDGMAQASKILAPEVVYLQFRYFDGIDWWDVWDSQTEGRLPRAIEVTLGLRPIPELTSSARVTPADSTSNNDTEEESLRFVQQIIAIPLSEPYIEEEAYY
ncbi:Pseudopilin GspJ [Maioricimonas rarisocia]|uniref:Type II secretion system protein J n=1 Tax=Maioricimonas rarisocia TaxID=2528026 RepID=A0A517Z5J8_9PLAN|nr:prepilin-type N-terminal cleavage/methylation domain-containing protein [Maioricimonas rarisocia]QDU37743.1 Pseudopilin GspJ [Maioricimonas rarisocia]